MSDHHMADHHARSRLIGAVGPLSSCICGAAAPDPLHGSAPCDWCDDDPHEFGAPVSWWARAWCRFVAYWLIGTPK